MPARPARIGRQTKATTGTSRGATQPKRAGDGVSPAVRVSRTNILPELPPERLRACSSCRPGPVDADGSARDSGRAVRAAREWARLVRGAPSGVVPRGSRLVPVKGRGVLRSLGRQLGRGPDEGA